ncbi:MAG: hypothetical protein RR365_03950 [Bacteroides sp.]
MNRQDIVAGLRNMAPQFEKPGQELLTCAADAVEKLSLADFAGLVHCPIEVRSGYNGKLLCKEFNPKKHEALASREVVSAWAEIQASKPSGYSNIARAVVCVYLHGATEYEANGPS